MDVTQLALDPARTGIQRVARAALRHWPGPRPILPCRFDPALGGLVPLPERAVVLLREDAPETRRMDGETLRTAVARAVREAPAGPALPPAALDRVLVPELFYDRARCDYYLGAGAAAAPRFLAFDFIPWLRPGLLDLAGTHGLMFYLAVLRRHAERVAFISEATRRDFAERILRGPIAGRAGRDAVLGPVLALGADGLASLPGVARQAWRPERDLVLALGSVDGRKNQHLLAAAAHRLRAGGGRLRLAVVGGVFGNAAAERQAAAVAALAARDPEGISHHPRLDDPSLAALLGETRATAYASESEGFGLPPLEGLALGIPALVPRALPSVPDGHEDGVLRFEALTEDGLLRALERLADDARAGALWREAAALRPPGWAAFGAALGRWAQA